MEVVPCVSLSALRCQKDPKGQRSDLERDGGRIASNKHSKEVGQEVHLLVLH